ncbi:hypothetical protein ACHAWF_011108 [Thalassiosira exigua]
MERHTKLFFSDEDAARLLALAEGRGRGGGEDGPSGFERSPWESLLSRSEPVRVLPTAEQCRRVRRRREREERELRASWEGGEPCVTIDSLPYVWDVRAKGGAGNHSDGEGNDREATMLAAPEEDPLGSSRHDNVLTSKQCSGEGLSDRHRHLEGIGPTKCSSGRKRKSSLQQEDIVAQRHKRLSYGLYSDSDVSKGGSHCNGEPSDDLSADEAIKRKNSLLSPDETSHSIKRVDHKNSVATSSCHGHHIQEQGDSSTGEVSDELISDGEEDSGHGAEKVTPASAVAVAKPQTLVNASEAVGRSIVKSVPANARWQSRRSESDVVLSRIKLKRQRNLLKRPRSRRRGVDVSATVNSPEGDAADGGRDDEELQRRRRSAARFAAAPVAANKRKKQMTLKTLFGKK